MSSMTRASSKVATPKSIINWHSAGGKSLDAAVMAPAALFTGCAQLVTGAVAANTLATMVNIVGGGVLKFARLVTTDATVRTLRVKITLDGVVAFDATTALSNGFAGDGMQIVGSTTLTNSSYTNIPVIEFDQVPFSSSCKIEVCSNTTETGKLVLLTNYVTT